MKIRTFLESFELRSYRCIEYVLYVEVYVFFSVAVCHWYVTTCGKPVGLDTKCEDIVKQAGKRGIGR